MRNGTKEEPQGKTNQQVEIITRSFSGPVVTKGFTIIIGGQQAIQDSETVVWILNPVNRA